MDYLQYVEVVDSLYLQEKCFKPYYKWITFNTIKNNIRDRIALAEF